MTSTEPPRPPVDVLGPPERVQRSSSASPKTWVVALVGASAVAVAGSAVAFAAALGGGGAQPEDVLPGNAFAMVKVDLDPAASQKLAVYELAKRFPSTKGEVSSQDRLKDELLSALFEDDDEVDYAKDVEPWIGDRIGIAAVPGEEASAEPLAAIAFTDRAEAERALPRLVEGEEEAFFAFSEKADYVLIASSQEVADAAARTKEVLADDASWQDGVDALDGDQIVTAWADLDGFLQALPEEAREEAAKAYGLETFELEGTVAVGVHATEDSVEVVGRALDVTSPVQAKTPVGAGKGSGLVLGLPEDAIAALSVTNLGPGLAEAFEASYGEDDPLGVVAAAEEAGIDLPGDLPALLGTDTVAAALSEEAFALRTRTEDPAAAFLKAQDLAAMLTGGGDTDSLLRKLDDGLAVGSTPDALDAIAKGDGGLGDVDAFEQAVPDAEDAGLVLYVDIARAIAAVGQDLGEGADDAEELQSFGITSSGDESSSTFRMRLTLKPE